MRGILGIATCVCACSATVTTNQNGDDDPVDAPITDDSPADAEILGAWGPPAKITIAADDDEQEDDGTLSYSGLELVYALDNGNNKDLMYATRLTLADPFGPGTILPFSSAATEEQTPRFSADDMTLFFAKENGANGLDIFKVTRPSPGSTMWSGQQLVAGVSSAGTDKWFMPCTGDRYLVIRGNDIAEGTLGGGAPIVDINLSSAGTGTETGPFLTQDCLTAYFASTRPPGTNVNRIYTSTRATVADPWLPPTVVMDFAALGGNQSDPFLSTDNRTFVFVSSADGTNDVYISTR